VEIIAIILFIVFMIASANDAKKKKASAAAKRRTPVQPQREAQVPPPVQPAAPVRPVAPVSKLGARFEKVMDDLNRQLEEAQQAKRRSEPVVRAMKHQQAAQGEAMLADPDCHGGSMEHTHAEGHSALEDEDCYGGSMEHTHSEGVSRSAHARRMAAIDEAHDEDVLPETIDAAALRRAVVMAEVLGKPKALQKY